MIRPSVRPAADLFDKDWSRVRGRRGPVGRADGARGPGRSLRRAAQMVRAVTGARAAVFKAIHNGGTHSRTELARQLAYVATKSVCVFDACGEYDGQRVLTPAQVAAVTARFAEAWDLARPTRLGHTSHLLLSFPLGTRVEAVRDVTRGVVEQFFQGEGARFDYLVAVHDDRAHRHAHVIVNRHSPDGEMFFLRSGHRFSYELFREAMVEHGDRHRLRLEATRRIDRGLVTYRARPPEVRHALGTGHEGPVRGREGRHLEHARRHIVAATSARLRDQAVAELAFRDVAQASDFARALERALSARELERLRQGDEASLARVADDRLDRLALAKAYLEAHPDTRDSAAHHRVLERIVDDQVAARRLARGHEDEGHVHG